MFPRSWTRQLSHYFFSETGCFWSRPFSLLAHAFLKAVNLLHVIKMLFFAGFFSLFLYSSISSSLNIVPPFSCLTSSGSSHSLMYLTGICFVSSAPIVLSGNDMNLLYSAHSLVVPLPGTLSLWIGVFYH
jgi:SNF family Na+-dependent transporter